MHFPHTPSSSSNHHHHHIQGVQQELEVMYIKGKMIRYVHIPEKINVGRHIQRHVSNLVMLLMMVGGSQDMWLSFFFYYWPSIVSVSILPPSESLPIAITHLQLDSLDVNARRFQRARLRPTGGGQATSGGGGAQQQQQVIQIRLPLPPAQAIRPDYVD